jgi:hypothetical protein
MRKYGGKTCGEQPLGRRMTMMTERWDNNIKMDETDIG